MTAQALRIRTDDRQPEPFKINFTKRSIERLQAGTSRRDVFDAKTPGLSIRLSPTGHRAFYFARRINGRYRRMKIGDFPGVTVEQARKQATKIAGEIASGNDPATDRQTRRGMLTLGELWSLYREHHAKPRCSQSTLDVDEYCYNAELEKWKSRKLDAISTAEVKRLHANIGKDREAMANKVIRLLRRLYRYAAKHYDFNEPLPTRSVEFFREESRERFLSPDEMKRFLKAVDDEGQPWSDFFRLCLYTAARRSNVQAMKWSNIDMKAKVWTIPASEAKAKRTIHIPLADVALSILKRRQSEQDASKYVFPPIRQQANTRHISQPQRPFKRIIERAGIEDLTIHDLRRTAGSWMAANGASLPQIGKALGHADARSTQIYARAFPIIP